MKSLTVSEVALGLARQLPLLDARRAGIELFGAPRFNLISLLQPDENTLSHLIADLLDPYGSHGQGALFLNALLERLDLPTCGLMDRVSVSRERLTPERRRIDLVIETPRFLVGIENKPWAVQQPNQLADYQRTLESWAGSRPHRLVFVSDQLRASGNDDIVQFSYSHPDYEWVGEIFQGALLNVRAPRVRMHIEELLGYLEKVFGRGHAMNLEDEPYVEAVKAIYTDTTQRRALSAIVLARETLHHGFLQELFDHIQDTLREHFPDLEVDTQKGDAPNAFSIKEGRWDFRRPHWPVNLTISIESGADYRSIFYGIRAPDHLDPEVAELETWGCTAHAALRISTVAVMSGRSNKWWPWLRPATTGVWDSDFAARAILHSPNGQIASHLEIEALVSDLVALAKITDETVAAESGP